MTKNKTTHNEFKHSREINKARPKMNQRELKANMQIIPTKNMFITKPKKKRRKRELNSLQLDRSILYHTKRSTCKALIPPGKDKIKIWIFDRR